MGPANGPSTQSPQCGQDEELRNMDSNITSKVIKVTKNGLKLYTYHKVAVGKEARR